MIEEISKVDGSVGWCTMIASSESLLSGWLHKDIARTMFGQPPDVRLAGSLRPEGRAYPVDGGYRIRGRWDFASGIHHANWLLCTCTTMDGDAPRQTPTGVPEIRSMLIPVDKATIVDTWSVVGMCGTGSHDFIVDDVFVPASHSFSLAEPPQAPGPLYHPCLLFVVLWTGTVANALGIARGAMDAFIALASQAGSTSSPTLLRDRTLVQTQVAEAEAILGADHVTGVRLKSGEEIPAQLVVMAVGIRANTDLAQAAGLHCNRGIVVNDTMQTFDPRIYAVGECVNHRGTAYGLVAPLFEMAKVCANHLAQVGIGRYVGSQTSTKLKVTGIDLFSAGNFSGGADYFWEWYTRLTPTEAAALREASPQ